MIPSIWAWLTSPENWCGTFGIANRLAQHVGYSLLVVLIAAAIGIPLGLWVFSRGELYAKRHGKLKRSG